MDTGMSKLVGTMSKCYVQGVYHRGRGMTVCLLLIAALGRFEFDPNGPSLKKSDSVQIQVRRFPDIWVQCVVLQSS